MLTLGGKNIEQIYHWLADYQPPIWIDNIGYYPLEANANDYSGNNNHATATNVSFLNNSANFTWNWCITVWSFSAINFTFHAKVKLSHLNGYQILFRYSNSSWVDIARCYLTGYGAITININSTSYNTNVVADTNENLYSFILTNNLLKFYVNGQLRFSQTINWVSNVSGARFSIANRRYNPNEWIIGTIKEVLIDSKIWKDTEVSLYYQRLHALSIYLWDQKVRPEEAWFIPWPNTIAYYPFKENGDDKSWKNNASFFGVVDNKSLKTNATLSASVANLPKNKEPRTITMWLKYNGNASSCNCLYYFRNPSWPGKLVSLSVINGKFWVGHYGLDVLWSLYHANWIMMSYVFDGDVASFYENWVKKNSASVDINTESDGKLYLWTPNQSVWFSGVIIENKVRTDKEILDYFNRTKSDYWL